MRHGNVQLVKFTVGNPARVDTNTYARGNMSQLNNKHIIRRKLYEQYKSQSQLGKLRNNREGLQLHQANFAPPQSVQIV